MWRSESNDKNTPKAKKKLRFFMKNNEATMFEHKNAQTTIVTHAAAVDVGCVLLHFSAGGNDSPYSDTKFDARGWTFD